MVRGTFYCVSRDGPKDPEAANLVLPSNPLVPVVLDTPIAILAAILIRPSTNSPMAAPAAAPSRLGSRAAACRQAGSKIERHRSLSVTERMQWIRQDSLIGSCCTRHTCNGSALCQVPCVFPARDDDARKGSWWSWFGKPTIGEQGVLCAPGENCCCLVTQRLGLHGLQSVSIVSSSLLYPQLIIMDSLGARNGG